MSSEFSGQQMAYIAAWLELNPPALPWNSLVGVPSSSSELLVTSLPATPSDGETVIFVDSLTAPTYAWRLRYIAAATKWFCIGGSPLFGLGSSTQTISGAGNTDITGCSITVPRAGLYQVVGNAAVLGHTAGDGVGLTVVWNGVGKVGRTVSMTGNGFQVQLDVQDQNTLAASQVVKLTVTTAEVGSIQYGAISVAPIYVT